jgi:hypothetical protein
MAPSAAAPLWDAAAVESELLLAEPPPQAARDTAMHAVMATARVVFQNFFIT